MFEFFNPAVIIPVVGIVGGGGLFAAGFVSASPGVIKVVSGPWGQRVIHGKTGWKIPVLERVDTMTARMISIDVKTADSVPTNDYINISVDAAVKVRIGTERPELFKAATRNFLYKAPTEIADEVRDTLEGHLRAIIGQMKLQAIVTDRNSFSEIVQENATKDLEEMGLEIVAFNIQGLTDDNSVIKNLGIDNTEQIRKEAAKARAIAEQEIAEQQAESDRKANDARIRAELEISQKQNDLIKQQAALKAEADTELAKADAAYAIEQETQRKVIEAQTAEANIVKQEKEAEVKEREVRVKERELDALIRKQAEAEKFARQQAAEAELIERQKKAEADLFEQQQQAKAEVAKAEALKTSAELEAKGIEAKGIAEAQAIKAKLEAEAEGLERKAEAMAKMNQAAIFEMYFNALPEVARAVSEPLANVDSITMYGDGNTTKLVGDLTTMMSQIQNGLGDSLGIDLKQMISTFAGVKAANSTTVPDIDMADISERSREDIMNGYYED